jgi:subtilisin-like proprotein convertase family protein
MPALPGRFLRYAEHFGEQVNALHSTGRPLLAAASVLLTLAAPARSITRSRPEEAPRATGSVLRALDHGNAELDVIVGVRDGTPSARALAAHPDPAGEPERRVRRLAAQKRLAESMPRSSLRLRRSYASFSMLAAHVTRAAAIALANRSDVSWVAVDEVRKRHDAPAQAAQQLIRSDAAHALGITGEGQAIAILDTGVDYGVAELGGGGFPNAKVVAGADLGDGDADPMDCEGHGTSVAAVAAGPDGVAPGAKIVALKVAKNASCDTARDSDILAAIDWAVTNSATYAIGAINLSFGGAPEDGADYGFCDDALPQYAASIEAARAAGIVFVASAGNDGLSNAIAAPACISSAVAVGAVYPDSEGDVAWQSDSGGTLCADRSTTADTIVCFSNSASNLALYAPGAFWLAPTRGGALELFHGTSAASPAVAGAVALLREADPALSPTDLVSLLRGTGRPIFDARNALRVPRIDVLEALRLPRDRFAAFDGTAVPIPDGEGSAVATATIEGFTGMLASVQADVEIDHDDPTQLVVTLTGPDGTAVLLHDREGSPHHPIDAIYGLTAAAAGSLGAFQGKPANGTWTLTAEDHVPLAQGRIRRFAVRMVPGQPAAAIPPAASTRVLPLVGHVQGTKLYLSDVRLYNPLPQEQQLSLFYVAQGAGGSRAVRSVRTVAPGRVLALDDVVGSEFGYADSIGQLTVLGPDTRFLATSRAYTEGAQGTFGILVPGFASADGIGPGQTASAAGLVRNARFHTNAGFTELSGSPVSVRLDVFRADGTLVASTTRGAAANANLLVTDIIGERGLGTMSNFRIDFTVTSAAGRVAPFATLIDNVTGDGVFVAAVGPAASAEDIVIPQASHAAGANGDFFRTDLHIANLGAAPARVTVSLLPRLLTGEPAPPRLFTIGPGETLESPDVLAGEFGLGDPSAAGLLLRPDGPARLAVSTRTTVEKFGGTFGFATPGRPASDAIGAGQGVATVIHLEQEFASTGFRSNFGFAEVAGADASVRVTALSGDTGAVLGTHLYALPAGRSYQASLKELIGSGPVANVYVQFSVASGEGRVLAYGVAIDNTSGDAIYLPAQKEP